jgi:hypothetical protein
MREIDGGEKDGVEHPLRQGRSRAGYEDSMRGRGLHVFIVGRGKGAASPVRK